MQLTDHPVSDSADTQMSIYLNQSEALYMSNCCSPSACIDNPSSALKFDKHKILKRPSLESPEIIFDLSFDKKSRKSLAVCILKVH